MTDSTTTLLHRTLVFFFTLFVLASTFSIALAQSALGVSLILFITICIKERYHPFVAQLKWVWLFVGLYVFWLLLSAMMGATPLRSVLIAKEEWLFLVMPVALFLTIQERTRRFLVTVLAVGVALISVYGVVQVFTGVAWMKIVDGKFASVPIVEAQGNFSNSMTFGNYCVTAGCFLIGLGLASDVRWGWRRRLFLVAGLLALVATVLMMRRGAIAAAVVSLLLLALLAHSKKRWLLLALSAVIPAIVLLVPTYQGRFGERTFTDLSRAYPGSRVYIWTRSLEIVEEHPVFGVGQGNFRDAYVAKLPSDISENRKLTHAHNDFINIAAIAGIPGALFFAGIWLAILHFLWRGRREVRFSADDQGFCLAAFVGGVAFLVTSLTEATFADEEVRQMLMFIWAVGLAPWYNGAGKASQRT